MMAHYLPAESDSCKLSEDLGPVGQLQFSQSQQSQGSIDESLSLMEQQQLSAVATVSAGSLIWSRPSDIGSVTPERKNSLSLPPSTYKPPTMLCVQELYLQHERQTQRSVSSALQEEDESGPDWFRNMDPSTNAVMKEDIKGDVGELKLNSHFDPLPLGVEIDVFSESVFGETNNKQQFNHSIRSIITRTSVTLSPSKSAGHFDDDIDKSFDRRSERMLSYLFERERIDDARWKPVILKLARNIASTMKIDVAKRRDSMNILTYVHVKKLVIEKEESSAEVIWGVVCSKSVAHDSMSSSLREASVMIVAGSIEYERVQGKLSSLEPIICQEGEFLAKQVERILSRRPSILLVEGGVSRVASELLRKAGVRLVVNVRACVLHRVARSTGADILPSSDAQLIQQNIGFCPSFSQRSIKLKDGRHKLLLVFDECPSDRGCSIILKGQNIRELKAVKRILLFMTSLIYSSQLEKAFLNMFNTRLAYQISNCDVCEARRENIDHQTTKSDFECALIESVLCTSPFLDYEPPFLETPKGRSKFFVIRSCSLLPYFKQPLYRFGTKEDFDLRKCDEETEIIIRNEDKYMILDQTRQNDVLDPYVHQRVAVLFGSFSPKSPNAPYFCVRPWVVSMEFYADHDMTLGEFLTKYCFNKSYECPSSNCEIPMLDHSRKLVYGRVCVEVMTQIVVQNSVEDTGFTSCGSDGQILAWHYCPRQVLFEINNVFCGIIHSNISSCKASSPVVALGMDVWHLSFGKYLDYLANSAFSKAGITTPASQECSHCFFHQQTHFYSLSNFVTTFKVSPIRPFHVQFSPMLCKAQPHQYSKQALLDGVTRMASLADEIIQTADDHLRLFTEHDHYTQYAGTFHTVLKQLLEKTIALVSDKRKYAEELKRIDRIVISSNDVYAVKANETLMEIREAIYQLITTWNDQSTVLGATISEINLERIEDPFPSYLHLGLKLQPRVGVVVRDIQDPRGNFKPDIGSIIAYALSAADYETNKFKECRRKQRQASGGEEIALNLNSNSVALDEAVIAAEHLEIEFQDSQASYYVKVHYFLIAYYAERFRLLRKLLFVEGEEAFIRSLSQSTFWTPQGGKSGSFFYRTQDDRFVVKQMSRFEIQSFVKFAPNYFEYIKTAVTENKLTTLCKVYGVFRVGYKSRTTQLKVDILVMEYLFYKHNVSQVWDLKGSLRNRMASTKSSSDLVLLDENLMKDLWNKQLYVYPHSKAALNQAISNDSHFLSSQVFY
uniref:1-phosphatidylinositol-3-phosphate 5-kinase n=1 Tax=Heterorhabditis bacteriophora TaxID=37862 RepID=A0A1I7XW62_HETBA